jgi:hypothetical protein
LARSCLENFDRNAAPEDLHSANEQDLCPIEKVAQANRGPATVVCKWLNSGRRNLKIVGTSENLDRAYASGHSSDFRIDHVKSFAFRDLAEGPVSRDKMIDEVATAKFHGDGELDSVESA